MLSSFKLQSGVCAVRFPSYSSVSSVSTATPSPSPSSTGSSPALSCARSRESSVSGKDTDHLAERAHAGEFPDSVRASPSRRVSVSSGRGKLAFLLPSCLSTNASDSVLVAGRPRLEAQAKGPAISQDVVRSFLPAHWLTDASIAYAYGRCEKRLRGDVRFASLTGCILFLEPACAHWLAGTDDVPELEKAKAALKLKERRCVFCPINDSLNDDGADSGLHWSLLLGWRESTKAEFEFVHFDSLASNALGNRRRAKQLAARLQGGRFAPVVGRGVCAQQTNLFDCGMYVVMFTEIILGAACETLRETSGSGACLPIKLQRRLSCIMPNDVTARRQRYLQLASDALQATARSCTASSERHR